METPDRNWWSDNTSGTLDSQPENREALHGEPDIVNPKRSWLSGPGGAPKRGLLSARVADLIERHIVQRGMAPGDRLPPGRELAVMFDVSRTVVRDAIAILEQRGLLESRPGSGVFVADGSSQAVADVLGQMLRLDAISFAELAEMRHLLEVHSAVVAATRASPQHVAALADAIEHMERARGAMAFVEADVAFHEELGRASGNRVLIAFLESLRPLLLQGMLAGTRLAGAREAAVREHTAILGAIRDHDEAAVRDLMEAHLESSFQEWREAERVSARAGEPD